MAYEYPIPAAIYVLVMSAAIFGLLYLVYDICCVSDPYPPPRTAPGAVTPSQPQQGHDEAAESDEDSDEGDEQQAAPAAQTKKDQ